MRKLFIAFVAAACALGSCSDDNTAEDAARDSIRISTQNIPATSEGGTTEIEVASSGDWRISGVCDWARPSVVTGRNGDTVTITVDPNDTDSPRGTTFKFFTGSAVAPLEIVSETGYSFDLISEADVMLGKMKTAFTVKLHTNIPELECTFSDKGGEWITYVGRTEVFGNTVLRFEVTENTTFDNRSTVLTISGMDRTLPVSVTQKQTDEILTDPESFELDLSEQTFSVDVSANVVYEVDIPVDWIQQVETRGLETTTLNFHIDPAQISRGAAFTITGAGITRTISVFQKDPHAILVKIPDGALRGYAIKQGWVVDLGVSLCSVTETGLIATTLKYNPRWLEPQLNSLDGIEAFPELTTIDVSGNYLRQIDLSKLTKVTSLVLSSGNGDLASINLGANPITNLAVHNGESNNIYFEALTIAGQKLTTLSVSITGWNAPYDELKSLDVSGCPALETLDCRRGDSLTTLYLKTGQVIPNLTKNDVTQIVYK